MPLTRFHDLMQIHERGKRLKHPKNPCEKCGREFIVSSGDERLALVIDTLRRGIWQERTEDVEAAAAAIAALKGCRLLAPDQADDSAPFMGYGPSGP